MYVREENESGLEKRGLIVHQRVSRLGRQAGREDETGRARVSVLCPRLKEACKSLRVRNECKGRETRGKPKELL